jgi:membrane protease YdiL (CAAX protease family)
VTEQRTNASRVYQLSLARPILVPLVLLIVAVLLRVVDIFLLPLAEATGEAFLHKVLGLVMVLLYLWAAGQPLAAIGLHGRRLGGAIFIGASTMILALVIAFGVQMGALRLAGEQAALALAAIDPKTGLAGAGWGFALWLFAGNLVNSFMEEGLFRGVMLTHFRLRLSPWRANLFQAVIFGLWHLAWPIWRLVYGHADLPAVVLESILIVAGSTVSGLLYGYLYLKTDSLWAGWIAHTINNTTLNLLHIRTAGGLDAGIPLLYPVLAVACLALLFWIKGWTRWLHMPELTPWGTSRES